MISDWYVVVEGIWVVSKMDVLLISIYAPQSVDSKRKLWDEIYTLISSFSGECVVMGDFNEVRYEYERFGSQFLHIPARIFNQFIEQNDLVGIPMGGPRYTWSNKWGSKFCKLDRFLVSDGITLHFPHIMGLVLDKKFP